MFVFCFLLYPLTHGQSKSKFYLQNTSQISTFREICLSDLSKVPKTLSNKRCLKHCLSRGCCRINVCWKTGRLAPSHPAWPGRTGLCCQQGQLGSTSELVQETWRLSKPRSAAQCPSSVLVTVCEAKEAIWFQRASKWLPPTSSPPPPPPSPPHTNIPHNRLPFQGHNSGYF